MIGEVLAKTNLFNLHLFINSFIISCFTTLNSKSDLFIYICSKT